MAFFWSFLAMLMVFMAYFSSLALPSSLDLKISTISAAPAFLPSAPLSSPPSLSPDITPLLPSPGGEALSPTESSIPTIPSSPSPPNPDAMVAPGPDQLAFPPSESLPASSSVSLNSSGPLKLIMFLGLLVFCLMQLSGM